MNFESVFRPALRIARRQDLIKRFDCAKAGMSGALEYYRKGSVVWGASRSADGLSAIDRAVAKVNEEWQGLGGAGDRNKDSVGALLESCATWLNGRKFFSARITGWREEAVATLYWRAAWCYSCDNYAQKAWAKIASNNAAGRPTGTSEPVGSEDALGNPYADGIGYTHTQFATLFRGDTRSPLAIQSDNGFQPQYKERWTYAPWFAGHAMGCTPSTTTDHALAINATKAAQIISNSPEGELPNWLKDEISRKTNAKRGGYVYKMNVGSSRSMRVTDKPTGREEVFLAIPNRAIQRWWVVLVDDTTIGPFSYPASHGHPESGYLSDRRQLVDPRGPALPALPAVPVVHQNIAPPRL
jgi:hypothetical protein